MASCVYYRLAEGIEVLRRLPVPVHGAILSGIHAEESTLFLLESL